MAALVPLCATAASTVAPIRGGNALTLPAGRHLVRMQPAGQPAAWLLALQQEGEGGRGLVFLRSADGRTWAPMADIQPDPTHTDRVDLVPVGDDVALVYGYEGPALAGSTRHDVFFQWWRHDGAGAWRPSPAVKVFDATTSASAYSRALLARDSRGRLWVQAFRLESGGGSTAVIAVSEDGGATFRELPPLARLDARGGGRLAALGSEVLFVFDAHDAGTPARFRVHRDADPPEDWGPVATAFSEGVYHGAALSSVAPGDGSFHLVYKDEADNVFHRAYRAGAWGARTLLQSGGDWAVQAATSWVGGELHVFLIRPTVAGSLHELDHRVLRDGAFSAASTLEGDDTFKGYPAAAEHLPATVAEVPCVYGRTPDPSTGGHAVVTFARRDAAEEPPPPPPPPTSGGGEAGLLFADDFGRTGSSLGDGWVQDRGSFRTDGRAISRRDEETRARAPVACGSCRIEADVLGFGAPVGLTLRTAAGGDRYQAVLAAGRVRLEEVRGGVATVLGDAASPSAPSRLARLSLEATGDGPASLVVSVNGAPVLAATDATPLPAGAPGLFTTAAGVLWDALRVEGASAAPPPPPPPPPPTGEEVTPFADAFERTGTTLGNGWVEEGASFRTDGRAIARRSTPSVGRAPTSCRDCSVEAALRSYGTRAGVVLRAAGGDRYEALILPGGDVELARVRGGARAVLGRAPSGTSGLTWLRLGLSASGGATTTLRVSVDGRLVLEADDASGLDAAGAPGIASEVAGVLFDDFRAGP